MIMGIAAVLVEMLALNAGPAMANELDGFFIKNDFSGDVARFSGDDVLFVDEGTTTLDELCRPGLPIASSSPDASSVTLSKQMTPLPKR
jgi:hypothetical protein